ncbi:MAG: tetratricopeptide repeat protein [Fibrobacterota bacterium]
MAGFYLSLLLLFILSGGCSRSREDYLDADRIFVLRTEGIDRLSASAGWEAKLDGQTVEKNARVDHPFDGSVYPPDIVGGPFIWYDTTAASRWLIRFSGLSDGQEINVYSDGSSEAPVIDRLCESSTNRFEIPKGRHCWTPPDYLWEHIKRSAAGKIEMSVYGFQKDKIKRVSFAEPVSFFVSSDTVGKPVFYRDVPLMPSATQKGVVKPLARRALPLINWRLRDISGPDAPVVMKDMPTCANCHSFSKDGSKLGMDMDGPRGDKGSYALVDVNGEITVTSSDVFSWNNFNREKPSFGLFSRVSPCGEYVVSAVDEEVYVRNYKDYRFLQTFYPTRSRIAVYYTKNKDIKTLPGADSHSYVQCNPVWTPDGKEILFLRARARSAYSKGPQAEYANDPRELQIKYDIYRIPFNEGKGGDPVPVEGASSNGMSNSFPKVSPDGRWIVFVKSKNGLLMRPDSRLWIIPSEGGEARELGCNLPLMNSWHSWSPDSKWMVFVSKTLSPFTRMFITRLDGDGNASPPVLIPNSTAANRAVNLPEFLNNEAGAVKNIYTPAVDYKRHLESAKKFIEERKFDSAFFSISKSLDLRPEHPDVHSTLSFVLDELGRTKEAVVHYEKALEQDPENVSHLINYGVLLNRQGRFNEAVSVFRKAASFSPDAPGAYFNWGLALMEEGDTTGAERMFKRSLEADPELDYAYVQLGRIEFLKKNYAGAVKNYSTASEINVRNGLAWYNLGVSFYKTGENKKAEEALKKAAELNPETGGIFAALGKVYSSEGRNREAAGAFKKAVELSPENHVFRKDYGLSLLSVGNRDAALENFITSAGLDPDYGEAYLLAGNIYMIRAQYGIAAEYYKKAMNTKKPVRDAIYNLCNALGALEKYEEVISICSLEQRRSPGDARLFLTRGTAFLSSGKNNKARSDFLKALKLNPGLNKAYYNLGLLEENEKNIEKALFYYRKFIENSTPGTDAAGTAAAKIHSLSQRQGN